MYEGKNLKQMSGTEWHRFRREVQVIFQDPFEVYNPFYKVDHALTTPIDKFHLAESKRQRTELIGQALEAVGLRTEETLGRFPHELSGGQRQRVMVARALLTRPRLIIADEPVSMVDASMRATILESLRHLELERGISIIYITHDLATAYQISQNIVVLYSGSVAEAGDVRLVIQQPQHPYTVLLVASVARADPTRRWAVETEGSELASPANLLKGCKFSNRCPFVMQQCLERAPQLFRTDSRRATACYRYKDFPILPSSELETAFASGDVDMDA